MEALAHLFINLNNPFPTSLLLSVPAGSFPREWNRLGPGLWPAGSLHSPDCWFHVSVFVFSSFVFIRPSNGSWRNLQFLTSHDSSPPNTLPAQYFHLSLAFFSTDFLALTISSQPLVASSLPCCCSSRQGLSALMVQSRKKLRRHRFSQVAPQT